MDIVSPVKEIEYKMGSYDMLGIDSDHTLVYSKSFDAMPVTSIKVQNSPCLNYEDASASAGTAPLPSEVLQVGDCPSDTDSRYTEARGWEFSEGSIMRESGVFDRLYYQEPSSVNHDDGALPGGEVEEMIRKDIELFRTGVNTRDDNSQKLWFRPTIPWKLSCEDNGSVSRQEALRVF